MTPHAFGQFLTLYTWFPLAGLLVFLLLIARFYQRFSGEKTYSRLFVLPMALFGAAAVRATSVGQLAGDRLAAALAGLAGACLIALCLLLYRRMVAGRDVMKAE